MRVLISGATGFIGRQLIPVLETRGHSLTLGLRNPEADGRLPKAEAQSPRRTVVIGEIDEHTDWREALQGADAVVHLAARAHVVEGGPGEEAALTRINARGTRRLVDQAVDAGVERFILMSSIGAVTTGSDECVTLNTPCTPDTPYGQSKRAAECALIERATGSQMGWTILRPTLVYGPGNPGNMKRLIALVNGACLFRSARFETAGASPSFGTSRTSPRSSSPIRTPETQRSSSPTEMICLRRSSSTRSLFTQGYARR